MRHLTFYRESNNFDDILKDPQVKKTNKKRLQWGNHLCLVFNPYNKDTDSTIAYLLLKYGDDVVDLVARDFTPIPNVDYIPEGDETYKKYLKSIS